MYQATLPTYYALADAVAFSGQQASHFYNECKRGSGKVVAVKKMFMINTQLGLLLLVVVRADVKRATAHSAGTAVTPVSCDSQK